MDELHKKLTEKSSWYRFWHKQPGHNAAHWAVFVFVGLFFTAAIYARINNVSFLKNLRGLFTQASSTITVNAGGNLQEAINSAQLGDTIILEKGATYAGTFTLPVKNGCNGTAYLTIQSSGLSLLPSGRVSPGDAVNMAKVVANNNGDGLAAFRLANGAGCYALKGLEITNDTTVTTHVLLDMKLGQHIVVDRNFLHPKEYPNNTPPYNTTGRWATVFTQSNHVRLTNNYIDGFYGNYPGQGAGATAIDSVAFSIENGPSTDFVLDNNYMSAWYNTLFLGGADSGPTAQAAIQSAPAPSVTQATLANVSGLNINDLIAIQIPYNISYCKAPSTYPCYGNGKVLAINGNQVTYSPLVGSTPTAQITIPSNVVPTGTAIWRNAEITNITITHNTIHIPTAFATWVQTHNGNHPKGYMEIKQVNGMVMEGNIFQGYPAIVGMSVQNQSGGSPGTSIKNVTIKNNWFKRMYGAVFASLADGYYLGTSGENIVFDNNLFTGQDTGEIPDIAVMVISGNNGNNITVKHQTVLTGYPNSYTIRFGSWDQAPSNFQGPSTFSIKDNIAGWGNYGWGCSVSITFGNCISQTESKNLLVLNQNPPNENPALHFTNSLTAPSWAAVKLVDGAGCNAGTNIDGCALAADSPGKNAASDGSDIGVNITQLKQALAGGASPPPPPPPPPPVGPTPSITSFQLTAKTTTSATISWVTDQDTTATLAYGKSRTDLNQAAQDTASGTTHQLNLTSLTPATTYYYKITATSSNGTASTIIASFRTK